MSFMSLPLSPVDRVDLFYFILLRFDTVEAAEKCIDALRHYRNLHPSFSKVREIVSYSSLVCGRSYLFGFSSSCSKCTKSPGRLTHPRLRPALRPLLVV